MITLITINFLITIIGQLYINFPTERRKNYIIFDYNPLGVVILLISTIVSIGVACKLCYIYLP